jgi:hypothetical protein
MLPWFSESLQGSLRHGYSQSFSLKVHQGFSKNNLSSRNGGFPKSPLKKETQSVLKTPVKFPWKNKKKLLKRVMKPIRFLRKNRILPWISMLTEKLGRLGGCAG